jgi:hypothetical protein
MLLQLGWFLPNAALARDCEWFVAGGGQPVQHHSPYREAFHFDRAGLRKAQAQASSVAPVVNTSSISRTRSLSTRTPSRVA